MARASILANFASLECWLAFYAKELTMPISNEGSAPQPRASARRAPIVLALAGAVLLLAGPATAQIIDACTAGPVPMLDAQPSADATSDRDAYRRQVTEFYRQHLTAYDNEARKFADDAQLLQQFRTAFQGAKDAVIATTATDIANGIVPVAPNGGGTLTNADPLAVTQTTPVQIGNRDLTTLEDNLAVDRAALQHSCDALATDRQILARLGGAEVQGHRPN
jgi:hypothetical protein